MENGIDKQIESHTASRDKGKKREAAVRALRRIEPARYPHAFSFLADEIRSDTTNSLHVGEDLSRSIRLPCLSVYTEQLRVGLHDRLEGTKSRACAKTENPPKTRGKSKIEYEATRRGGRRK